MKVLFINPSFSGGGAERNCRELLLGLRKRGHHTALWSRLPRPDDPAGVQPICTRAERLLSPLDRITYHTDWRHFGSILHFTPRRLRAFDVVHLHSVVGPWLSLRAVARLCRLLPTVWTLHDEWAATGGLDCDLTRLLPVDQAAELTRRSRRKPPYHLTPAARRFQRFFARCEIQPDLLLCPSLHMQRLVAAGGRFPHAACEHLPNGVALLDSPAAALPRAEARRRLDLEEAAPVVLLAAARLDLPHKGIDLGVQVIRQLAARHQGLQVLALGEGIEPLRDALSGIPVRGGQMRGDDAMAAAYRAADVTLIPSRADNFPYVALESLACRTPVVAFAVGGLPEIVGDDARGRLAPPFDLHAMAAAASPLLADPLLRDRLGDAGRAWLNGHCAMPRYLDRIESSYAEAIRHFEARHP